MLEAGQLEAFRIPRRVEILFCPLELALVVLDDGTVSIPVDLSRRRRALRFGQEAAHMFEKRKRQAETILAVRGFHG